MDLRDNQGVTLSQDSCPYIPRIGAFQEIRVVQVGSILTWPPMIICVKRKLTSRVVSVTFLCPKIDLDFEGVEGLSPDPEKHQLHMLVQVIYL